MAYGLQHKKPCNSKEMAAGILGELTMTYEFTYLWKYNKTTGYWEVVRDSLVENAERWLEIFQSDNPNEHFKLAKRRPNAKPAGA